MRHLLVWLCLLVMSVLTGCGKTTATPSPEFLESTLIVRPGIDDLGSMKVKQFVDMLARVQKPDGTAAELLGWEKTDEGYVLTAKIAKEFDLEFVWSKADKIVLLNGAEVDGETVPGMQFFMLIAGMPKVAAPSAEVQQSSVVPAQSNAQSAEAPVPQSAQAEIAAADAAPTRKVSGVILQALECNDTCQLKYVDADGSSQAALCNAPKECRSWAEAPKTFMPLIGAKADLMIGKKYVPEGGITLDSVVEISFTAAVPAAAVK